MKCPKKECGGRLLSKIVREREGEVYRRRYCDKCKCGVTTLERVVTLNSGNRARLDIGARRVFDKGNWWEPRAPEVRKTKVVARVKHFMEGPGNWNKHSFASSRQT